MDHNDGITILLGDLTLQLKAHQEALAQRDARIAELEAMLPKDPAEGPSTLTPEQQQALHANVSG